MPLPFVPSLTAEMVCLARALESRRPPSERLVDDPFAVGFLRRPERLAARAATLGGRAADLGEDLLDPGLVAVIAARHGWIDERARRALPEVDQVLVLGAGYDSRAWRLALGGRVVVELDHPATAARKARRVQALKLPPVPVVTADLAREPLPAALGRSPLDPQARTLVIWEGVTMYLREADVRATLANLRAAWPSSQVVLDLWTGGTGWWARAEALGRIALSAVGEPIRYHPGPDGFLAMAHAVGYDHAATVDIAAFAAARGRRAWPALSGVHLTSGTIG